MQENWQLGRRKSLAVDAMSEGAAKKDPEKEIEKLRPRSQSLTVNWPSKF